MKNAIFAAIIAGFLMTSVSFAEDAHTATTTTTEHAAPAAAATTDASADHMAAKSDDHMASKKHTKMTKTKHNADGSKETTHKETKEGAAE